ncbi:hypothetical protein H181DRAFT_04022 [Streptomyces sp. WMMB 714]|uniref:hypothetical protein n=1 Tax=Streptomyces sp. WMMB 714 TaxID=1286822 RepID=UPI000823B8C7|nr:hypothetical protein [Streptomyces sp. WMMB 714]SCK45527.1 hypothetical protein H181DRAFT_04022 [Streptomyces sp. WMMB 714]
MEPRELWERHTVLARAFCQSDEEVRAAQTTLDDAQTSRVRSLAAFAVVVGNDKAVAEMLGLHEREVRIARRTVGRDDARTLADELLMPSHLQQPPGAPEDAARTQETPQVRTGHGVPGHTAAHAQPHQPVPDAVPAHDPAQLYGHVPAQQQAQAAAQHQQHAQAQQYQQAQHHHGVQDQYHHAVQEQYQQPHEHMQMYDQSQMPDHLGWSPVQDAVLVDGWQSGVDLEILALELGTDLRRLTARAQYLSTQGRLFVQPEETSGRQGGKHRRESAPYYASAPSSQMSAPGDMLLPDGLVPDGQGGYWANWNEMLPAPQG